MRARILAGGLVLAAASGGAYADLYIWRDPATGATKIYSYPPPWYGNPQLERRSPKVERVPERQRAPAVRPEAAALAVPPPAARPMGPDAAPPGLGAAGGILAPALLGPLEEQRRRLLDEMAAMRDSKDPGLTLRLEGYRTLVSQMDRIDPAGAEARRADLRTLIERTR